MPYCPGGTLFSRIQCQLAIDEDEVKFYAACLVLAIEHMHAQRIIHRDIKPENALIDEKGYIVLSDFGISGKEEQEFTTCGTPEYLAPEFIKRTMNRPASCAGLKSGDWWALGCLCYEALTGKAPFQSEDPIELNTKILESDPEMMCYFEEETIDFLKALLQKDPNLRLGANGSTEVKEHPFFDDIDWEEVEARTFIPDYIPNEECFSMEPTLEIDLESSIKACHLLL